MFFARIGLLVAAGLSCSAALAAPIPPAFEDVRRAYAIPSLAVAAIDRGEIVYAGTLGGAESCFRVASLSKLLTAQAVMMLVEQDRLSLDGDVAGYIPAFKGRGITIRMLLQHRSGLRDTIRPVESGDAARVSAYVAELAAAPHDAPGQHNYTDADYNLLGAVIEVVTRQRYPDFVRQHILAPLGLRNTSMFAPAGQPGCAPPYFNYGVAIPAPARPHDIAYAPSEGMATTIEDLSRWLEATLNRDPRLLRAESHELLFGGLGWQIGGGQRPAVLHGGSFIGMRAWAVAWPNQKRGVLVLANAHEVPRQEIAAMADAMLDGKPAVAPSSPQTKYHIVLAALLAALLGAILLAVRRFRRR